MVVVPLQVRMTLLENKKRDLVTGKKRNSVEPIHYSGREWISQDNPASKKMLSMGVYAS